MRATLGPIVIVADTLGPVENPYMRRWYVQTPIGTVRVHNIVRSDAGRDLHDHPWDFASFVLRGGYREVTATSTRDVTAPAFVLRRAEDLHRLELARPAWTFVLTGPRRRTWGFDTPAGWVRWNLYTGEA